MNVKYRNIGSITKPLEERKNSVVKSVYNFSVQNSARNASTKKPTSKPSKATLRSPKLPKATAKLPKVDIHADNSLTTPWTHQFIEDEKVLNEMPHSKFFSPLQKDEVERLIKLYQPSTRDALAFDYDLHAIHCLTTGDVKSAAENFFRATFTDSTNPTLLLKRAYCEAILGDTEKALKLVDKAVKSGSDDSIGLIMQYCIYLGTGNNLPEAAFRIRFAIAKIKMNIQLIQSQLTDIRVMAEWEETPEDEQVAQQLAEQLTLQEKNLATAYSLQGELHMRIGCEKLAEKSFEQALSIQDDQPSALLGLARSKFVTKNRESSCHYYSMLLEQGAEDFMTADDWARYAYLCSMFKSDLDAVSACTSALSKAPPSAKHAFLYLIRAESLMKGMTKTTDVNISLNGLRSTMCRTVMKDVDKALEINPKLKLAYCVAAACYAQTGQYKMAVEYLDKILKSKSKGKERQKAMPNWEINAIASRADMLFKVYQNTKGSFLPSASQESLDFLKTVTDNLPQNISNYKQLVSKSPLYRAVEDCRSIVGSHKSHTSRAIFSDIISCVVQDQKKKKAKKTPDQSIDKLPLRVADGTIMYL